jgi:hypothetical protein
MWKAIQNQMLVVTAEPFHGERLAAMPKRALHDDFSLAKHFVRRSLCDLEWMAISKN